MYTNSSCDSDDIFTVKNTKKSRKKQGQGIEWKKVSNRIRNFDPENSIACIVIRDKLGDGVIHSELRDIAILIAKIGKLKIDRDAKRDSRVLFKWFDENWDVIEPIFLNMTFSKDNHFYLSN